MILEAVNYLIRLSDTEYKRKIVEYVSNLRMNREDKEMYVSVFEEVYKEEGRKEGRDEATKEFAKNSLANGISPDVIAAITGLSLGEIRSLMN
jgi:predicted transposase/invertase (TIGR01784 family)